MGDRLVGPAGAHASAGSTPATVRGNRGCLEKPMLRPVTATGRMLTPVRSRPPPPPRALRWGRRSLRTTSSTRSSLPGTGG